MIANRTPVPERRPSGGRGEQGVALITALLVVALASIAAVSLVASHQLDIRRAATSQGFAQSQLHGRGIEALAQSVSRQLYEDPAVAEELLAEGCRTPPIGMELDGIFLEARLEDLHCRLNLNNLADEEDEETEQAFIRLVEDLAGEHEISMDPEAVVVALREWIDPEIEDDWYRRQTPPYRPGNQPLAVTDELLLVRGMDRASYHALEPHVTALPATGTELNLLLAPERIRAAYNLPEPEDIDPEDIELGDYIRLSLTMEIGGRLHHRCTIFHGPSGEVVRRRLEPC